MPAVCRPAAPPGRTVVAMYVAPPITVSLVASSFFCLVRCSRYRVSGCFFYCSTMHALYVLDTVAELCTPREL